MAEVGGRHRRSMLAVAMASVTISAAPALARIQDYQVARVLSYQTQCEMSHLEDRSPKNGPMRFFAECENKTFYPDGIEISCADRDDDRSCRLLTKQKKFDQLHLLDRK